MKRTGEKNTTNRNRTATLRSLLANAAEQKPNHTVLRFGNGTEEQAIRCAALYEDIMNLGSALANRGFGWSHVACIGDNAYPWVLTMLTALAGGGVFAPIDASLAEDVILRLVWECDAEILFCSARFESLFRSHRHEIPRVRAIVNFDRTCHCGDLYSFESLLEEGMTSDHRAYDALRSSPGSLKYLAYTLSENGDARGVMLTEHNIVSCIRHGSRLLRLSGTGLAELAFSNTFSALCDLLSAIDSKRTLCVRNADMTQEEALRIFRPDYICLTPEEAEELYIALHTEIRATGLSIRSIRARHRSDRFGKMGTAVRRLICREMLNLLGGNLRQIVFVGSAPRSDIVRFFRSLGIRLSVAYGTDECSALISVRHLNGASPVSVRIACVRYRFGKTADGDGELLLQGDTVMLGYYKRADLTAQHLRGSWLNVSGLPSL